MKPKAHLLIKEGNQYRTNQKQQVKLILKENLKAKQF